METKNSSPSRTQFPLVSRRSFVRKGFAVGAATAAFGLLPNKADASITPGDGAILRFLSALEILETDLWQQYNELGGIQDLEVPGGTGNKTYTGALATLDSDMAQYIHDNTEDEFTHFNFIKHSPDGDGGGGHGCGEVLDRHEFVFRPTDRVLHLAHAVGCGGRCGITVSFAKKRKTPLESGVSLVS